MGLSFYYSIEQLVTWVHQALLVTGRGGGAGGAGGAIAPPMYALGWPCPFKDDRRYIDLYTNRKSMAKKKNLAYSYEMAIATTDTHTAN